MPRRLDDVPEWLQLSLTALVAVLWDRRRRGLVKEYRELKAEIDGLIKRFKLYPDQVYFMWGDPDDPEQRAAVDERITNFMNGLSF